ncbi:hypothetical protein DPMN_168063 [Dreissena polymorpha]|uniref:Uncharacterized protein n=1 Tax=Dreissena polymorpha TaxID=45954 RepID=A0A9D4IYY5_DREPO|nr:hypothetical protein DPMN_168063 [Dreissena polymorpha]
MAYTNETVSRKEFGEASSTIDDICRVSLKLEDLKLDFNQDGMLISALYKPE